VELLLVTAGTHSTIGENMVAVDGEVKNEV
jgi:hypothetical protein